MVTKSFWGVLIALVMVIYLPSLSQASTIVLQSGQKIEGTIIDQNQMRITADVKGMPKTFFLGEIASIDGKAVEIPEAPGSGIPQPVSGVITQANQDRPQVPYFNDEQDSLARFMVKRDIKVAVPQSKAPSPAPVSSTSKPALTSPAPVQPDSETQSKTADANKNVVSTPDGGIIVVSSNKITKYDKDLNVVKNVDLK